jgi:hypothetical protein
VRSLFDIHDHDTLDEAAFTAWIRQASELLGAQL